MKTLPNAQFAVLITKDGPPATAASLIALVLNQSPKEGFDFSAIRVRLKITDKLDKLAPGSEIQLEDAEFAVVRKAVEDFRWSSANADLVKFAELFGL